MGEEYHVSSGQVVSGFTLEMFPMYVYYGGTVIDTTVDLWGYLSVSSGGTANSTTVNDGGWLSVSSGGTANSTTVNSGGDLVVSSGGTANSTTVNDGGDLYVSSGGTANSTTVNDWGKFNVEGGTANYTTVDYLGSMYVYDGGTANSTTVNFYGRMYVSNGGTANATTVNSSGHLVVSSGGTANSTTVNSWGRLDVSSGGTANSTTVNSGYLYVSSGGTADLTTVLDDYAILYVDTGAVATHTVISSGEVLVFSGGTADAVIINAGSLIVSSGGTAAGIVASQGARLMVPVAPETYIQGMYAGSSFEMKNAFISGFTVSPGGGLGVYSGGTANNTTVNGAYYAGQLSVASGGIANSTTVNSNGFMYVFSGGTVNRTTVNSYGRLVVSSGGSARQIVENGGYVDVTDCGDVTFVSNTFSGLVLPLYKSATVHSGTTAVSTTVGGWGHLCVYVGGSATETTVLPRGSLCVSGGTAAQIIAAEGAYLLLTVAPNTYIQGISAGSAFEMKNAAISNYVVNSGGIVIASGGTAVGIEVSSGALGITVAPNTYIQGISAGSAFEMKNAVFSNYLVGDGGKLDVLSCGSVNKITVSGYEADMQVSSGGTADFTTVNLGDLTVYNGGTVNSTTVNSNGYLIVSSGGTAVNTIMSSTCDIYVSNGGMVESTIVNGGRLFVYGGGTANSTKVNQNGFLIVSSGGTALQIMENGGEVSVDDGADVSFLPNILSGLVLSHSAATLHSGTTANSMMLNGCTLRVYDGGSANDTVINSGGRLYVYSGGTASSTIINSYGFLVVSSGGTLGGLWVTPNIFGNTSVFSGAEIHFDVSERATSDGPLFNRLFGFDAANFTVTVSASQKNGIYKLAAGASGFNKTVTIRNTDGASGNLSVGNSIVLAEQNYTLNLEDGLLSLTIGVPDPISGIIVSESVEVSAGETAEDLIIVSGGRLWVSSGGMANNIAIQNSGYLLLSGQASQTLIDYGGTADVYHAGNAESTFINYGGSMRLTGSAEKTTVNSGGTLSVANDGIANSTLIDTCGQLVVGGRGTANSTKIGFCGDLYVGTGGTANFTQVDTDGYFTVQGGMANSTTNSGYMNINGGSANATIVESGGELWVESEGSASMTSVNSGGRLFLYGTATTTTINAGGSMIVGPYGTIESGGTALGIVENGGYANIWNAAEVSFLPNCFSGIELSLAQSATVHSGTTANATDINSGGLLVVYGGGVATATRINAGGELHLTDGGTANLTEINNGGKMTLFTGCSADSTVINSGGMLSGGTAINTTVNPGGVLSVDGYATVIYNPWGMGELISEAGGIIGLLRDPVYYGNSDSGIVSRCSQFMGLAISANMSALIYDSGCAYFTSFHDGGDLHIYAGGSAYYTAVSGGGKIYVYSGGTADITTVHNDGCLTILNGGIVRETAVSGSLSVSSGGKVTGSLEIASGAVVSAYEGSIIDFDISDRTAASPALVNDLSRISGTPAYTITVSADQADGVYTLAGGASGFAQTVTIGVEGGGSDRITVGETVTLYGQNYTLNLADSLLSLTVGGSPVPPTPVVGGTTGDLNMDGRADIVMTIDQDGHAADGSTGAWLIQEDQTAAWGDLSTRNPGWEIFGTGKTAVGKNTDDVYIKSSDNVVGAWTTADDGKVNGWETIGEFSSDTQIVGLGDFNGNGQTDLLLRNTNGAVGCFFTIDERHGWNYFQSLGDEWKLSAVGDLNVDGRDDVVLKHDAGFAGSWLTQADGTMAWADLDTLPEGFEIVGAGDFNADGTDDVLLKSGNYYGAWLVNNGNAAGWMGLGDLGDVTVEQIADFNGDGTDDLRIRTAAGDLGTQLVMGADDLVWKYYGSVGSEWKTGLAALC